MVTALSLSPVPSCAGGAAGFLAPGLAAGPSAAWPYVYRTSFGRQAPVRVSPAIASPIGTDGDTAPAATSSGAMNMHANKRQTKSTGTGGTDKTAVMGMV